MLRQLFDDVHNEFRDSFRRFVNSEIVPFHEEWEEKGIVDKSMFLSAGHYGFLGMAAPDKYGGGDTDDFRFNMIMTEELQRVGVWGSGMCITLHNDVCLPYILNNTDDAQKARWLPDICSGDAMLAIAMTEPGAGSDLGAISTRAELDNNELVVNGSKIFITNGINADLVITAVKTDISQPYKGMTLLVIEGDTPGFSRGKRLKKLGLKSQDTAELIFTNARVPKENVLGEMGSGFAQLMDNLPQERLSIALSAVAGCEAALAWTIQYCKDREAFGSRILDFQNTRFTLASLTTKVEVARVFVDRLVEELGAGELTPVDAAKAKWWCTELQLRVTDACLQLHGGYGYMLEYPIARAYADARIQTIYGGTTEIMKDIIGRGL